MPVDTNLEKLIINKNLTKEQFEQAILDGSIGENDLSFVDDDSENASGSGRNVGDIFYTTRLDTELNGAVECNGGIYSTEDFTGSQSIGNLLTNGSLPYVSLEEYASLVSANGYCRTFGWDGGIEFRVPTIPALLLTKNEASVVGNGMTIGLTNGITETGLYQTSNSGAGFRNIIYGENVGVSSGGDGSTLKTDTSVGLTTDSEKSGIVANLNVVEYRAMVQLANSATDEAVITATSALQQIANKVDRSEADYVVESYVNGTEWYRVYKSGWVEQGGSVSGTSNVAVTFLKPFKDTNYTITSSVTTASNSDSYFGALLMSAKTETGFTANLNSVVKGKDWVACGQGV